MTLTRFRPVRLSSTGVFGFALMALGIMAFAYPHPPETAALNGLSTGPLQTTVERADTIPLVAIAGMLLLAGGIAVLVMDWTDRSV